MKLPAFEDELFEEYGNTSRYTYKRRPPIPVTPDDALDSTTLTESIRELTTIMSTKWTTEGELSSEEIQIRAPSSSIRCKVNKDWMDVLYNPTVGANIMSKSFATSCLGDNPCSPTAKTLRVAPRTVLKGLGILHHITLHAEDVDLVLDFHIFDIQDFDILIGHPLEKLYADPLRIGEMNVKLGRDTYSIQVTRAKNSVAKPLLT